MWYNQIMFYDYEKGVSTDENERILDFCQVHFLIQLFFFVEICNLDCLEDI